MDPWANAWGDPLESTFPEPAISSTSWTGLQSQVVEEHQEADIAAPSWSTSMPRWDEPSDVGNSLWTQPSSDLDVWEPSPYENISITNATASTNFLPSQIEDSMMSLPRSSTPPSEKVSFPSPAAEISDDHYGFPPPASPSPVPSRAQSPDAFGSFESGIADASWIPTSTSNLPASPTLGAANEWGSTWEQSAVRESQIPDEPPDEWEVARQQKEKQDRYVPPEFSASILRKCQKLADELWPEKDSSLNSKATGVQQAGMDGVEGLAAAASKYIPQDLTLPLPVTFDKTVTFKYMNEGLRKTRHSPLVRIGPMAHFVASKGSTAWETALKAKSGVVADDTPPGWRIVEKKEETPQQAITAKSKKAGGLLSFFGRKVASPPPEKRPPEHASLSSPKDVSADVSRPNLERAKSITPTVSPSPTPKPALSAPAPPVVATPPIIPQPEAVKEVTPPSTISRFLNRISRAKAPSGASSIALSSDDLEFLSDIVPSASDDLVDAKGDQLLDLSSLIEPAPSKTILPPSSTPLQRSSVTLPVSNTQFSEFFDPLQPSSAVNTDQPPVLPRPLSRSTTVGPSITPANRFPQAMMKSSSAVQASTSILSPMKLPPPPSSRSTTPLALPAASQPLPPLQPTFPPIVPSRPSSTLAPVPAPTFTSQTTKNAGDDDFTDFYSSPPPSSLKPAPSMQSFDLSFSSSTSSTRSLISDLLDPSAQTQANTSFDFDDFDDFVTSPPTLRTPSPPRPPAKAAPPPLPKPCPAPSPSKNTAVPATSISSTVQQPVKTTRKADHTRTLSLLENAAARSGRWPSPPSPLPEALPPPGGLPGGDLLGDASTSKVQRQQENSLRTSASSPAGALLSFNGFGGSSNHPPPLPPPGPAPRVNSPPLQPTVRPPSRPLVPTNTNTVTTTTTTTRGAPVVGGLSAQDLSFFEGL